MSDWHGLYSEGWSGEIVPEAFATVLCMRRSHGK